MSDVPIYELIGGVLFVSGKQVSLPRAVEQVLVVGDKVIYRFVADGKVVTNRNIGAITFNGDRSWTIGEVNSNANVDIHPWGGRLT